MVEPLESWPAIVRPGDARLPVGDVVVLAEKGRCCTRSGAGSRLNSVFHYQLTCIGQFAPVYVAEALSNKRFKVGWKTGMKVSWQADGDPKRPLAWPSLLCLQQEWPTSSVQPEHLLKKTAGEKVADLIRGKTPLAPVNV
jgi:hypothetical protein